MLYEDDDRMLVNYFDLELRHKTGGVIGKKDEENEDGGGGRNSFIEQQRTKGCWMSHELRINHSFYLK